VKGAIDGFEKDVHDQTEKWLGSDGADIVTKGVDGAAKGAGAGYAGGGFAGAAIGAAIGFVAGVAVGIVDILLKLAGVDTGPGDKPATPGSDKPAPKDNTPAPTPAPAPGDPAPPSGDGSGDDEEDKDKDGKKKDGSEPKPEEPAPGPGAGSDTGEGQEDGNGGGGPFLPLGDCRVSATGLAGLNDLSTLRILLRWPDAGDDGSLFDPTMGHGAQPGPRTFPVGTGYVLKRSGGGVGYEPDQQGMGRDGGWTPVHPILAAAALVDPHDAGSAEELDPNGKPVPLRPAAGGGRPASPFRPRPVGFQRISANAFVLVMRN
jgi:hypothetical protein